MASHLESMHLTSSWHPHPQTSNGSWKRLIIISSYRFILWLGASLPLGESNPHLPLDRTWTISNPETGTTLVLASQTGPKIPWFPDLTFDLCKLAEGTQVSCSRSLYKNHYKNLGLYICPGGKQPHKCGGPESYYCASWGCETSYTGNQWVASGPPDLIKVTKGQGDPTGKISFTSLGKKTSGWELGKSWGLRLYKFSIGNDPGMLFILKLQEQPAKTTIAIRPNPVLKPSNPQLPAKLQPPTQNMGTTLTPPVRTGSLNPTPALVPQARATDNLYNLVLGAYSALNYTQSALTQSCWLCLTASPPYYEGIAVNGTYNITTGSSCDWNENHRLILPEVSGQGTCLGHPPDPVKQALCSQTFFVNSSGSTQYLIPPKGTRWACNTGLTPCVSTQVFNNSAHFCVMVRIFPRVVYHQGEELENKVEGKTRFRRELVSTTLATLLGGTGATAIQWSQQLTQLQAAIDRDLRAIETSEAALQDSLPLSSEVLQNRRRLDLSSMKEGALCAALGEKCCFYVDRTGIVREQLDKLRERIREREEERLRRQGLITETPWFIILMSTLAGLLFMLLLIIGVKYNNKLLQGQQANAC